LLHVTCLWAAAVSRISLDREFVLRELMDTALQAKQNQQWSASNRLLELLGKELGMFNRPEFVWDGDLALFPISSSSGLPNNLKRSPTARIAQHWNGISAER
jgi:hypothetical protein